MKALSLKPLSQDRLGKMLAQTPAQLRQRLKQSWQYIKKEFLTDPQPEEDDLWWIVPQRRIATTLTCCAIALSVLGSFYWMRRQDANFDDPNKKEQVAYLNNNLGNAQDELRLTSNLFGTQSDTVEQPRAELRRICHNDLLRCAPLDSVLVSKHVKFTNTIITPDNRSVLLQVADKNENLRQALQALALANFIERRAATSERGEVYSFALEWQAYRGDLQLEAYREHFHLRADGPVESGSQWAIAFLVLAAIVFSADFTHAVFDYRWGKYYKALVAALAEALKQLNHALDIAGQVVDDSVVVSNEAVELLRGVVALLEKYVARDDRAEAREIEAEAHELLRQMDALGQMPRQTESEHAAWRNELQNIRGRVEKLHDRVRQLGLRSYQVPIGLAEIKEVKAKVGEIIWRGYDGLREVVNRINLRREARREQHEHHKEKFRGAYALEIRKALNQKEVVDGSKKLGKPSPTEMEAMYDSESGDAERRREHIENRGPKNEDRVSVQVGRQEEDKFIELGAQLLDASKIILRVEKKEGKIAAYQYRGEESKKIAPTSVTRPALNPHEHEEQIEYVVAMNAVEAITVGDTLRFEINSEHIILSNPKPDPEPWFRQIPLPAKPKVSAPTNATKEKVIDT